MSCHRQSLSKTLKKQNPTQQNPTRTNKPKDTVTQPHTHMTTILRPFSVPPGWAGARRELLDFMVQGEINRGRHTNHPAGHQSIRTNRCPPPPSPIFYRPDAFPAAQPTVSVTQNKIKQEGQRAANLRLLANQWAKRRLVTQWHYGCRAMRRSVCNAGASNAGQSLCVQISREWRYPLPIYWYHSKGNWLRYNSAAESFYIIKCQKFYYIKVLLYNFSADFSSFIVEIVQKTANVSTLSPFWGS